MLDGLERPRPGDQRAFIHKKILGGVSKLAGFAAGIGLPGARAVSTITGAFAGRPVPRIQTARVTQFSQAEKQLGRQLKFGGGGGGGGGPAGLASAVPDLGFCFPPWQPDPVTGRCKLFVGDRPGGEGVTPVGDAVLGRYGAGLSPGFMEIRRAICLPGMQLGNDGVCYNKSQISNKQRMWPAGRKPLLTGGDMRAIAIASRAGRRLEVTTKRLQKMGMMKKPATRRVAPAQHQRLLEAHVTK